MPNSVPSKAWDIHGIRAAAVIVAHLMVAMGFSTKFLRPKAELQPSSRVAMLIEVYRINFKEEGSGPITTIHGLPTTCLCVLSTSACRSEVTVTSYE